MRKRKPGAGRKPAGPIAGKRSTFSTRITAETRGALEAEAAIAGQSISQLTERLLLLALELKRDRDFDDPVRALGYLIGHIAEFCRSTAEDGRDCEWYSDPSVFETFRLALGKLLEQLRPPGEIDNSVEGPLVGSTPEHMAEYAFRAVWKSLQAPIEPLSPSKIEAELMRRGRPLPAEAIAAMSRTLFAKGNVQRALNIKVEETKP